MVFSTHPHSLVIRVQLTQPPGNKALVTSAVPASARLPRPVLGWRRFCVASGGSVSSTDIRCACWGIYNPKSSAWRVSSLLIVPGERPNRRAIARMLCPWFFISAMISRSSMDRNLVWMRWSIRCCGMTWTGIEVRPSTSERWWIAEAGSPMTWTGIEVRPST